MTTELEEQISNDDANDNDDEDDEGDNDDDETKEDKVRRLFLISFIWIYDLIFKLGC